MNIYAHIYGELQHWARGSGVTPASLYRAAQTWLWGSAVYRWYFRWRQRTRRRTRRYSASQPVHPVRTRDRRAWQDYRPAPWTPALERRRIYLKHGYLSRKYKG